MEDTHAASASAAREAREARARLYGATVSYADKANLASSLAERLERGGGVAGVDDGASATQTAALLVEWSLAVLAWAGLAARASGGGGKGAKSKNGGAGSGAGAGAGGAPARPPRAVGANAPSPASACADPAPWRALIAGLAEGDRRAPNARHAPAPTAAAHLIHAAAAAASAHRASATRASATDASASKSKPDAESKNPRASTGTSGFDPVVLPSVVADALARLRGRLGAQFRPASEHCLAAASAALRADPNSPLARETLRATARSVRASPHRAPPAPDAETLDAILLAAAAEVRGEQVDAESTREYSTREYSTRVPEDGPASSALRAALMHPSHLAGVPRAFADAAPVDPRGSAKRRKAPPEDTGDADVDAKEGDDGFARATREPARAPEFVRVVARRVISSARERGDVAALAPWILRAFVEETNAIAAASGAGGGGKTARGRSADEAANVGGRLLFDALFAPISESPGAAAAGSGPEGKKRGRGGGKKHANVVDRESNSGRSDVSVAPELVRELRRAGLYSLAAVGGGPAPSADRPPVRDRLTAYAERVYAQGGEGDDEGKSTSGGGRRAHWTEVVAATEALIDVDVRLVEPHAAAAIAAAWRAKGGASTLVGSGSASRALEGSDAAEDADEDAAEDAAAAAASIATRCFAKIVDAYASTRRLPEFLDAVGAAAATTVSDAPTTTEKNAACFARTPGSPAAIAAATRAAAGIPSGQTAAAVSSAHGAMSRCVAALSDADADVSSLAGERATALASFVASILAALPAVPGEALPANAESALRELTREIRARLRDWFESRRERGVGGGSKKTKKPRRETESESSPDAVAAIAGSSLACLVPAAAILEVCHDRQDLHGEHARAYLGEDGPSLAETCAEALDAATRCESEAVAAAVGRAVAGAAMHRVAQLARVARPPPAGVSDANAEKEARALVAVVVSRDDAYESSAAEDSRARARRAASNAVAELTRECADVWTPWAEGEALAGWARRGGDDVFQDVDASSLWAREIGDALAAAAARLAKEASEKNEKNEKEKEAKKKLADAAVATAEAASRGDAEKTAKRAAAFWKLAEDAVAGASESREGNDSDSGSDSDSDSAAATAALAAANRVSALPDACASSVDVARLAAAVVAVDCAARAADAPRVSSAARRAAAKLALADPRAADVFASFVATLVRAAAAERRPRARADAADLVYAATLRRRAPRAAKHEGTVEGGGGDAADVVDGERTEEDGARRETTATLASVSATIAVAVREAASNARASRDRILREKRAAVASTDRPERPARPVPRALRATVPAATVGFGRRGGRGGGGADETSSNITTKRTFVARVASASDAASAALAEAAMDAAADGIPRPAEEFRLSRTADPDVGAAATLAWSATKPLRDATDDAVVSLAETLFPEEGAEAGAEAGAEENLATEMDDATADAAASFLGAAAASFRVASAAIRHGAASASVAPDARAVRAALVLAAKTLTAASPNATESSSKGSAPSVGVSWVTRRPAHAAKAAEALDASVGVLTAAGPPLSPSAHAALVAVVLAAYDAGCRASAASKAAEDGVDDGDVPSSAPPFVPAPPPPLAAALERCLASLTRGAGKRLVGATYRAIIDRLRAADAAARRVGALVDGADARADFAAACWSAAASAAAPAKCAEVLLDVATRGSGGKGARAALEANAESLVAALCGAARFAAEGCAGRPSSAPARAVVAVAIASLVSLSDRGDKTPLSARCVARMAQTPLVVAPALESPRSVRGGFAPACALLASLLRARKREMRRSAALVTASCASLLDILRGWRRAREAEAPGADESDAETRADADADADDAARRAGTALGATYEAANAAGLDRYCAHLLADAVTACGADGVGAAAERAVRPGLFALLDACGDRELQQLHAALGSQSGGARRVTLAALVEEHRRSHKYDGKV